VTRSGEQRAEHQLVGREDELAALQRALLSASEGRPQLVLVEGAAGVGKSALLRAFGRSVGDGVTVLRASGDEAEQHLDFGVIEQLHADGEASGLPVLTVFGRGGPRPDPLDIGADVVRVAAEASAFGPIVALIDDAQWADQASLQALTYAARRFRDQRLVIVIAQRPDVSALAPLARLCQDERGTRVRLGGLAAPQIDALLRTSRGIALGEHAAQRLREHTQGNPLEALTLADELDADAICTGIGPLPAPRSYATLALSRLAACRPETERLVAAVAVMGTPVEVGALVDLLGRSDVGAPADALDEAVAGGHLVIIERAGRQMVEVAHPLLRAAVVADLAPGIRSELHSLAATITDDPARAMMHRIRGTIGHDPDLGAGAVVLSRRLLNTGWDLIAVELLSEAARVLPEGPSRSEALLLAANRLFTTGELVLARQLLAAVRSNGGALESLVRGQAQLHAGEPREARRALKSAWEQATDPRVAGQAAGLLATLSSNAGRGSDAVDWARAALAQADAIAADMRDPNQSDPNLSEPDLGDSELGNAFVMLATGWAFEGDLDEGLAEIDRSLARIGPRFDRDDAVLARALLLMWSGRFAEADATFAKILDSDQALGPLLTRVSAGYSRADCRYRQGAWDDALAETDQLIALMEAGDHDLVRPMTHGVAAFVHAGRGAVTQAERHLAKGRAAQQRSHNTSGLLWLLVGEARIGSATGDHQRVIDHLSPLADMLRGSRLGEGVQPWRADLVEAFIGLGRPDEAAEALAELERQAEQGGEQVRIGVARVGGLLAVALGDDGSAEATFAEGLERDGGPAEGLAEGGPFPRARLELAAGSFARRRGQRRRAADLLTAALDRFDALGAEPYLRQTRTELNACGLAPRPRNGVGAAPLSPAERQVAELVAEGLTNREVAGRLHVSVKTIETHVARCFTKLEVRNRTALALHWAERTVNH
jgi:DNA-binding CsgD family transcriptional regulator/tetratricopeptide (TPR) repeat protein